MLYRAFAIVFYLAAAAAFGMAAYAFWSGYPMTLGLGGGVPLLWLFCTGIFVALGNYASRAAGPR